MVISLRPSVVLSWLKSSELRMDSRGRPVVSSIPLVLCFLLCSLLGMRLASRRLIIHLLSLVEASMSNRTRQLMIAANLLMSDCLRVVLIVRRRSSSWTGMFSILRSCSEPFQTSGKRSVSFFARSNLGQALQEALTAIGSNGGRPLVYEIIPLKGVGDWSWQRSHGSQAYFAGGELQLRVVGN